MSCYVYLLKRPSGVPFYVGKGSGRRCRRHFEAWLLARDPNRHKANVIRKLQRSGFSPQVEIVSEGLTEEAAFALEREQIALYGRTEHGGVLTNKSDGGEGQSGFRFSAESRHRLSVINSGPRNPFFGRKHTPETLSKIGSANRGKTLSNEWRSKLSAASLNVPKSEEHRKNISLALTGRKFTDDWIRHMSESQKGKKLSTEHREKIKAGMASRKLAGLPVGRPKSHSVVDHHRYRTQENDVVKH